MVQLQSLNGSTTRRDQIYEILKQEILTGGFQPGDTLNIVTISRQLNVSGAPVREAIGLLNKDGLVDVEPYKKATVAAGNPADFNAAYDMREFLEPYAARTSLHNIPQEAIDSMRDLLNQVMDNPDQYPLYYKSDNQTHELLYRYSDSKLLVSTLDHLRVHIMRYYAQLLQGITEKFDSRSAGIQDETREHLELLDAIESGDAEQLEALVRDHIKRNRAVYKNVGSDDNI